MNLIDVSDIDFVKTEPKEKIFMADDNDVLRVPLGTTMIKSPDRYQRFPKVIMIDVPTLLTLQPEDCDVSIIGPCEIRVNNGRYIFMIPENIVPPFGHGLLYFYRRSVNTKNIIGV